MNKNSLLENITKTEESLFFEPIELKGKRSNLSKQNLNKNIIFAKNIKMPDTMGMFSYDINFEKTITLFERSSDEIRSIGLTYLRKILPTLTDKTHLLDIGPGDGKLLKWIGNFFSKVTAVDINSASLDNLNHIKRVLRKKIPLHKIYSSVLDLDLGEQKFNLINLSHVLYYIAEPLWLPLIKKLYGHLTDEGKLVITVNGDTGTKAELIRKFGGTTPNIDGLAKSCIKYFGADKMTLYYTDELVKASSLNAMMHLASFFLRDGIAVASKSELADFLVKKCFTDNIFALTMKQKIIIIQKN